MKIPLSPRFLAPVRTLALVFPLAVGALSCFGLRAQNSAIPLQTPPNFDLIGFASVQGYGMGATTGGGNAPAVTVRTASEFQSAVERLDLSDKKARDETPRVVLVAADIDLGELANEKGGAQLKSVGTARIRSNTTILASGQGSALFSVSFRQFGRNKLMGMQKQTEIVLTWELHQSGLSQSAISRRLGRNRETVRIWLRGVEQQGLKAFLDQTQQVYKAPRPSRQVDALIKRHIWAIREREHGCCGQKIAYFLEKEQGVKLSVPKIYEVLAQKYVIRSKWKKNKVRGEVPVARAPREVIEMDTINFGGLFAFTAVDIFSREADVLLRPALTAEHGAAFLHRCMRRRFNRFVQTVQTDGGSEFEAEFALQVWNYCGHHRIARPYKKNEQAHIESFNRTFRKECLGWGHYKAEDATRLLPRVEAFLERYHYHRPHLSFEPMRPPLQE